MLELQPARLGQRPELLNTQEPIRLRHACQVSVAAQRAAAASQPADWYRPTVYGPTDRPEVTAAYMHVFLENVIIFVTTTPIDTKPSSCPAHGRHACACKKSRHRTTRRLGGDRPPDKINSQIFSRYSCSTVTLALACTIYYSVI